MADVEAVRASSLEGIAHGFLGRRGGASTEAFSGLNVGLSAADDQSAVGAAVAENRIRARDAVLSGSDLVMLNQVHSAEAIVVDAPWSASERPQADAMVTKTKGLLLGIVTADCAPILFADRAAGVVGAAHAGWRGAHDGVIEATIAAMESLGAKASSISAAIGPCIAQKSYEVDDVFRDQFGLQDARFFAAGKPGHYQFDLERYVAARLESAGIAAVEPLGLDTYSNPDRFYSYRRATHREEPNFERQISLIGLNQ